jgi:Holliday junction resolvase RusA-like endonuclease
VRASLVVIIPGRVVSNNAVARASGGRVHKGARAREYQSLAAACVREAASQQAWCIPECARVAIVIFNTHIDADNGAKLLLDALKGVAITDDDRAHVRGVSIEHVVDGTVPRVEIAVMPCEPCEPAKTKRRKPTPATPGPDIHASFSEAMAEAKRRTAALRATDTALVAPRADKHVRTLDEMRSGDMLSMAERDALLKKVGIR